MTTTAAPSRIHAGLDCADAEALFQDIQVESDNLKAKVALLQQVVSDATRDREDLRLEHARLRALLADMGSKLTEVSDERDALAVQNKYLTEEWEAAESATLPEDTLVFSAISTTEMTALYRRASRITRGPLPPVVLEAVGQASSEVAQAMHEAGAAVLDRVIRREVRRRRRQAARSGSSRR